MKANVLAAGRPLLDRLDRIVYATITLISVLIIYDGWVTLKVLDVVGIIVGPIVAMFIAHVFSTGLARHVKLERRMTGREWLETVRSESRFLLLAAPPVALLIVFDLAGASVSTSVHTIIWLEGLSLGFWAGLAALRAGLKGWSLALAVLVGLVVAAAVLALEVVLQPGKAVENGTAAGFIPWG